VVRSVPDHPLDWRTPTLALRPSPACQDRATTNRDVMLVAVPKVHNHRACPRATLGRHHGSFWNIDCASVFRSTATVVDGLWASAAVARFCAVIVDLALRVNVSDWPRHVVAYSCNGDRRRRCRRNVTHERAPETAAATRTPVLGRRQHARRAKGLSQVVRGVSCAPRCTRADRPISVRVRPASPENE
jgi:hypothetical protein